MTPREPVCDAFTWSAPPAVHSVAVFLLGPFSQRQRKSMSYSSVDSSSRASFSSESDLLGRSNTWKVILDLVFRHMEGGILRKFWGWNGATAMSGTCEFSVLLAPVRRALVWPVFSPLCRGEEGFVLRLAGRNLDRTFVPVHPLTFGNLDLGHFGLPYSFLGSTPHLQEERFQDVIGCSSFLPALLTDWLALFVGIVQCIWIVSLFFGLFQPESLEVLMRRLCGFPPSYRTWSHDTTIQSHAAGEEFDKGDEGLVEVQLARQLLCRSSVSGSKQAFLLADALTETSVKPPHLRSTERCWRLKTYMYGTLPAAAVWPHLVQNVRADIGLLVSSSCPCALGHKNRDLDMVVHGGEFILLDPRKTSVG